MITYKLAVVYWRSKIAIEVNAFQSEWREYTAKNEPQHSSAFQWRVKDMKTINQPVKLKPHKHAAVIHVWA